MVDREAKALQDIHKASNAAHAVSIVVTIFTTCPFKPAANLCDEAQSLAPQHTSCFLEEALKVGPHQGQAKDHNVDAFVLQRHLKEEKL